MQLDFLDDYFLVVGLNVRPLTQYEHFDAPYSFEHRKTHTDNLARFKIRSRMCRHSERGG